MEPNIDRPVIQNEQFYLCLRSRFGAHTLLYGAQIDGLLATGGRVQDPPNTTDFDTNLDYLRRHDYLEIKVHRLIKNRQIEKYLMKKLRLAWLQCYLANLKGVLVGFRNDKGIIKEMTWFNTEDIPKYCESVWQLNNMATDLDNFLKEVKFYFRSHLRQRRNNMDQEPLTLEFSIDNQRHIKAERIYEKEKMILPDWFVRNVRRS